MMSEQLIGAIISGRRTDCFLPPRAASNLARSPSLKPATVAFRSSAEASSTFFATSALAPAPILFSVQDIEARAAERRQLKTPEQETAQSKKSSTSHKFTVHISNTSG
jgi:hypothetical protein